MRPVRQTSRTSLSSVSVVRTTFVKDRQYVGRHGNNQNGGAVRTLYATIFATTAFTARRTTPPRVQGIPWRLEYRCPGEQAAKFLVHKEIQGAGRTVGHARHCPFLGAQDNELCDCPVTMSHRTLENYREKLAQAIDRSSLSDKTRNPFRAWECKAVVATIRKEQLTAGVSARVTRPLWVSSVVQLSVRMLSRARQSGYPYDRARILMHRAFIIDAFRTLTRATQLGHTLAQTVVWLPNKEGLVFNYSWGKTLRDGTSHVFAVKRDTDEPALCLVAAIEDYVGAALEANWLTPKMLLDVTNAPKAASATQHL